MLLSTISDMQPNLISVTDYNLSVIYPALHIRNNLFQEILLSHLCLIFMSFIYSHSHCPHVIMSCVMTLLLPFLEPSIFHKDSALQSPFLGKEDQEEVQHECWCDGASAVVTFLRELACQSIFCTLQATFLLCTLALKELLFLKE